MFGQEIRNAVFDNGFICMCVEARWGQEICFVDEGWMTVDEMQSVGSTEGISHHSDFAYPQIADDVSDVGGCRRHGCFSL